MDFKLHYEYLESEVRPLRPPYISVAIRNLITAVVIRKVRYA
jgi:hypothetical protein